MNKKGFTLTELLAVLVLLTIIFAIAIINYSEAVENRKNSDYNNIVDLIVENTKVLVSTDFDISSKVDEKLDVTNECKIGYDLLIQKGLMDRDTKNPLNDKVIDSNSYIIITIDSNDELEYEFVYVEDGESGTQLQDCLSENIQE